MCPRHYEAIGQKCYILILEHWSWFQAAEYCRKIGAKLPSLHSLEESKALFAHYHPSSKRKHHFHGKTFWIGGHKLRGGDKWEWWDGSEWDYSHLDGSVKDGSPNHCLAMKWDWAGKWVDAPCMTIGQRKGFYCEKEKIPSKLD